MFSGLKLVAYNGPVGYKSYTYHKSAYKMSSILYYINNKYLVVVVVVVVFLSAGLQEAA